jgi:hypothetical protein
MRAALSTFREEDSSASKTERSHVEKGPCALIKMIIQQRRVVVTGVGLVSPVGVGTEVTWKALLQG